MSNERSMLKRRGPRSRRVRSAHGLVLHHIGLGILRGEFPVGTTLPGKAELMERFGVSRTALREALQTLTAKGLIASKTKVGTSVLDESHWNMFDADILAWRLELGMDRAFLGRLFEMRMALEPLAATLAAVRRTEADLQRMEAILAAMARTDHGRDSFTDADLAFHVAVLEASANPFMQSIGALIEAALAAAFTISSPIEDRSELGYTLDEHRAIYDAIARRDPQAAADAMSAVILRGARAGGCLSEREATLAKIAIRRFGS